MGAGWGGGGKNETSQMRDLQSWACCSMLTWVVA